LALLEVPLKRSAGICPPSGPLGGYAAKVADRMAPVPPIRDHGGVGVREDCRHYVQRTTTGGEVLRRCRLGVAEETPFACPEGCLFFEARVLSTAGWAQEASEPMSNTAWGLAGLPPSTGRGAPPGRAGKNKKKGRKPR